ncbi:MAG: DMT family transporter, partial [Saprospiraceae bacterium]|nr:DMT family transporter [Saprospiraceae bacterium]
MYSVQRKSYLQLHLAVLLFGFAAILGDLINLTAVVLVWWRLFITLLSLPFLVNILHEWRKTNRKFLWQWAGIGILVALHWIAFFASIKLANASVALVCLATATVFTSFFEPIFNRSAINLFEVVLALLVVPCMILIVSDLDVSLIKGVWAGLLSAALLSLFGVLNKRMIHHGHPMFITFVELGSGWLLIGIYLLVSNTTSMQVLPVGTDWLYLVLLAIGCTTFGYVLVLYSLKHLSAFTAMLAFNLEPVYGMILAFFLLGDASQLSSTFYIGGILIIILVFLHAFLQKRLSSKIDNKKKKKS